MDDGGMEFSYIILGLILLVFGRKLFWLFIGIAGFLFGMELTGAVLAHQPLWLSLFVALGAGFVGALLAVFLKRIAFALAGFYAGSYLALIVAQSFATGGNNIVFLAVGGVVGALFAAMIMDWAIIVLSCLVGSGAVVAALDLGQPMRSVLFVALLIAGTFVQARFMTPGKER